MRLAYNVVDNDGGKGGNSECSLPTTSMPGVLSAKGKELYYLLPSIYFYGSLVSHLPCTNCDVFHIR